VSPVLVAKQHRRTRQLALCRSVRAVVRIVRAASGAAALGFGSAAPARLGHRCRLKSDRAGGRGFWARTPKGAGRRA